MVSWKNMWPEEIWHDITPTKIGNRTVETFQNILKSPYHALVATNQKYGEKVAIIDNWGNSYTYSKWLQLVDEFAECLHREHDVKKGTHVGLLLYNSIEFCVAFLALCKLGAVTIPLPSKYKKDEIMSLAEKGDLTHLIHDEDFLGWISESKLNDLHRIVAEDSEKGYGFSHLLVSKYDSYLPAQGELEDPNIIMFTSGTTSQSKGVLLRNYNVMQSLETYRRTLNLTEDDSTIIAVPIYHITGLVALLSEFLLIGGTMYLHKMFDPERVLACVQEHDVTFLHGTPTVFIMLLQKSEMFPHLPSLTQFACGSSNMPPEVIGKIHEWIPQLHFRTIFGMTETSAAGTIFPCGAENSPYIGSSGVPMPDLDVKIIDDDGTEMPNGSVGEITLHSSFILENYYNVQNDAISEDGWLKSGDLGYINEAGYLYVVDRKKDMINRGGEKICSFDVENELYKIPGIIEAAVVGIPDEKYIEIPVAMIRLAPGVDLDGETIRKQMKGRIASFKIPTKIVVTDNIPKTPNGKINKREIRSIFPKN